MVRRCGMSHRRELPPQTLELWGGIEATVNRVGDYGEEDFHLHVWTVTGKEKTGDYPKVDPATLNQ